MLMLNPGVAQLVARMVRVHEAVGSNPATRTSSQGRGFITESLLCYLFSEISEKSPQNRENFSLF